MRGGSRGKRSRTCERSADRPEIALSSHLPRPPARNRFEAALERHGRTLATGVDSFAFLPRRPPKEEINEESRTCRNARVRRLERVRHALPEGNEVDRRRPGE